MILSKRPFKQILLFAVAALTLCLPSALAEEGVFEYHTLVKIGDDFIELKQDTPFIFSKWSIAQILYTFATVGSDIWSQLTPEAYAMNARLANSVLGQAMIVIDSQLKKDFNELLLRHIISGKKDLDIMPKVVLRMGRAYIADARGGEGPVLRGVGFDLGIRDAEAFGDDELDAVKKEFSELLLNAPRYALLRELFKVAGIYAIMREKVLWRYFGAFTPFAGTIITNIRLFETVYLNRFYGYFDKDISSNIRVTALGSIKFPKKTSVSRIGYDRDSVRKAFAMTVPFYFIAPKEASTIYIEGAILDKGNVEKLIGLLCDLAAKGIEVKVFGESAFNLPFETADKAPGPTKERDAVVLKASLFAGPDSILELLQMISAAHSGNAQYLGLNVEDFWRLLRRCNIDPQDINIAQQYLSKDKKRRTIVVETPNGVIVIYKGQAFDRILPFMDIARRAFIGYPRLKIVPFAGELYYLVRFQKAKLIGSETASETARAFQMIFAPCALPHTFVSQKGITMPICLDLAGDKDAVDMDLSLLAGSRQGLDDRFLGKINEAAHGGIFERLVAYRTGVLAQFYEKEMPKRGEKENPPDRFTRHSPHLADKYGAAFLKRLYSFPPKRGNNTSYAIKKAGYLLIGKGLLERADIRVFPILNKLQSMVWQDAQRLENTDKSVLLDIIEKALKLSSDKSVPNGYKRGLLTYAWLIFYPISDYALVIGPLSKRILHIDLSLKSVLFKSAIRDSNEPLALYFASLEYEAVKNAILYLLRQKDSQGLLDALRTYTFLFYGLKDIEYTRNAILSVYGLDARDPKGANLFFEKDKGILLSAIGLVEKNYTAWAAALKAVMFGDDFSFRYIESPRTLDDILDYAFSLFQSSKAMNTLLIDAIETMPKRFSHMLKQIADEDWPRLLGAVIDNEPRLLDNIVGLMIESDPQRFYYTVQKDKRLGSPFFLTRCFEIAFDKLGLQTDPRPFLPLYDEKSGCMGRMAGLLIENGNREDLKMEELRRYFYENKGAKGDDITFAAYALFKAQRDAEALIRLLRFQVPGREVDKGLQGEGALYIEGIKAGEYWVSEEQAQAIIEILEEKKEKTAFDKGLLNAFEVLRYDFADAILEHWAQEDRRGMDLNPFKDYPLLYELLKTFLLLRQTQSIRPEELEKLLTEEYKAIVEYGEKAGILSYGLHNKISGWPIYEKLLSKAPVKTQSLYFDILRNIAVAVSIEARRALGLPVLEAALPILKAGCGKAWARLYINCAKRGISRLSEAYQIDYFAKQYGIVLNIENEAKNNKVSGTAKEEKAAKKANAQMAYQFAKSLLDAGFIPDEALLSYIDRFLWSKTDSPFAPKYPFRIKQKGIPLTQEKINKIAADFLEKIVKAEGFQDGRFSATQILGHGQPIETPQGKVAVPCFSLGEDRIRFYPWYEKMLDNLLIAVVWDNTVYLVDIDSMGYWAISVGDLMSGKEIAPFSYAEVLYKEAKGAVNGNGQRYILPKIYQVLDAKGDNISTGEKEYYRMYRPTDALFNVRLGATVAGHSKGSERYRLLKTENGFSYYSLGYGRSLVLPETLAARLESGFLPVVKGEDVVIDIKKLPDNYFLVLQPLELKADSFVLNSTDVLVQDKQIRRRSSITKIGGDIYRIDIMLYPGIHFSVAYDGITGVAQPIGFSIEESPLTTAVLNLTQQTSSSEQAVYNYLRFLREIEGKKAEALLQDLTERKQRSIYDETIIKHLKRRVEGIVYNQYNLNEAIGQLPELVPFAKAGDKEAFDDGGHRGGAVSFFNRKRIAYKLASRYPLLFQKALEDLGTIKAVEYASFGVIYGLNDPNVSDIAKLLSKLRSAGINPYTFLQGRLYLRYLLLKAKKIKEGILGWIRRKGQILKERLRKNKHFKKAIERIDALFDRFKTSRNFYENGFSPFLYTKIYEESRDEELAYTVNMALKEIGGLDFRIRNQICQDLLKGGENGFWEGIKRLYPRADAYGRRFIEGMFAEFGEPFKRPLFSKPSLSLWEWVISERAPALKARIEGLLDMPMAFEEYLSYPFGIYYKNNGSYVLSNIIAYNKRFFEKEYGIASQIFIPHLDKIYKRSMANIYKFRLMAEYIYYTKSADPTLNWAGRDAMLVYMDFYGSLLKKNTGKEKRGASKAFVAVGGY